MKLCDLDGSFVKYAEWAVDPTKFIDGVMSPSGIRSEFRRVATLAEADGVRFQCPLCKKKDVPGSERWQWWHPVHIGFSGRARPGDYGTNSAGVKVLWDLSPASTCLDDLVLTPSIQIQGGCNWHGFLGSNGVPPGEAA